MTYYSCKQRYDGSRVMTLSNQPANSLSYERIFVERNSKVYFGYRDKLASFKRVRLNLTAANTLFGALGIPLITP